jgi:hypothetical protein
MTAQPHTASVHRIGSALDIVWCIRTPTCYETPDNREALIIWYNQNCGVA